MNVDSPVGDHLLDDDWVDAQLLHQVGRRRALQRFSTMFLPNLSHLLHETVVADKTPWRPLEGGYRWWPQFVSIPRDEILLSLGVTCAKYVDVS